jgi:hypothetical protein
MSFRSQAFSALFLVVLGFTFGNWWGESRARDREEWFHRNLLACDNGLNHLLDDCRCPVSVCPHSGPR